MRQRVVVARVAAGFLALGIAGIAQGATGQQLYASCAACHGTRGEGNSALGAPAIAGQYESYLRRQLQNFRAGVRGSHAEDRYGAQMRAATAVTLRNDADLGAVAKYIAALPRTTPKPTAKYDARNGNNLYQGKCGACHGGRAEGNEALAAPRLAGLDAAYLERQLRSFRSGVRGAHANDKAGRQMALMAATVTAERDVADVIGHVQATGTVR